VPRFHLPPQLCAGPTLFLSGREAHHAIHVLRLRRGDRVTVLDGAGAQILCDIEGWDRDKVSLTVTQRLEVPPLPYRLTLVQALPKGKLIESIIQKATELGAFCIVPLLSERVVAASIDQDDALKKVERWKLAAVEAIKQCGNPWLPQIELPLTPAQFLSRQENSELTLIASLHPGARHPREFIRTFQAGHGRKPQSVCVWVGPEGDFTPEEVALVTGHGASPISLGPLVLRAETAAIYCLSILSYEQQ